jgi:hypothetical protein
MWIFPTRSRPNNCRRFIEAWKNTNASTPVYVRIDNDDPCVSELTSLDWPNTFNIIVGEREGLRAAMQEMFVKNPHEDWYGLLADDLLPRTQKWDLLLIEQAGKKSISYPNDLGEYKDLPTHPIAGGDLIRELGWFGFPAVQHYYVDTIFQYLGNQLNNLHRMDDVIVEHVHPDWKKAEVDNLYQETIKKAKQDKRSFEQWISSNGESVIKNLKEKGF